MTRLALAFALVAATPALAAEGEPRHAWELDLYAGDGTRPWRTFRPPAESASAVVEVVGELTREELRQVAFQEFLVWFRQDLRRFLHSIGGASEPLNLASATLPVDRFGGNPVPRNVPLGRADF